MRAAAALSFGVALIHGSVMVQHFREWWLFGLFFALACPLQLAWCFAAWRWPDNRRLLAAGAIANLLVACVWLVSRTTGLPFGPERLQAEAIGFKDVIATWDELLLAGIIAMVLLRLGVPRLLLGIAWVAAVVSLLAASIAGSH